MPLNLASPGILIREIDLTTGRVQPTAAITAALVGPFAKGPVGKPILIESENQLLTTFGEPYPTNKQYEYWLSASSYLSYGGDMRIVRSDDADLRNAFVGTASSVKIKSLDHYTELGYDENLVPGVHIVSKDPGSWANGLRVAVIDSFADQELTISTENIPFTFDSTLIGCGVTQSLQKVSAGVGVTTVLDGYLKGVITGVNTVTSKVSVKVLSHVSAANTETNVEYQESGVWSFEGNVPLTFMVKNTETLTSLGSTTPTLKEDWFELQTIGIGTVLTIDWDTIAPKPGTSEFAEARGGRFDELHIIVIDGDGKITGNAGSILEKHIALSKASDGTFSVGSPSYWRKYLAENSDYIFGGSEPGAGIVPGFTGITTTSFGEDFLLETDNGWDQPAEGVAFAAAGAQLYILGDGTNYNGADVLVGDNSTNALEAKLADIAAGYDLFENPDDFQIDFLMMGSANYSKEGAQSLANKLISVAELRKDCVAFISPSRGSVLSDTSVQTEVTVNSAADITENLVSFYSPVASTTYAVFDSGYKYMYDRFSDTFRYVPLNGDVAGLCARTDINQFPWYSPAGTNRGAILNAVKLPYNPSRTQRDRLYTNRINPVIFSPGAGIILFGDKTGYGKASAFDRINVRRLFIYLERAIARSARDVLFEFNDQLTRNNFVNTIEPFLRDVKAKRGIFDFLVVCDERNNTPAVIDNNEFIADIYIKPSRSINFIGLNFIATKTGVNFEEVIGTF
jgi:hypothetical protein